MGDLRLDDGEQDVEVVHHKVEDDRHIGATWVKQSQTMCFDEQGLFDERLSRDESRVEAFHMPHLHLHPRLVGQLLQGIGLFGGSHDGLLDEDMLALRQGLGGTLEMTDGRRHDVDDVDGIDQRIDGVETMQLHLRFNLTGGFGSGVEKPHQVKSLNLFDAVDMDFPEMARS